MRTIYPPTLEITYSDATGDSLAPLPITFEVAYESSAAESAANEKAWNIATAVLISLGFLLGLIPFVSWTRREGTMVLSCQMFVKFFLCVGGGIGWAFLLIVFAFSFYWFLQNNAEEPSQPISAELLAIFVTFAALAFVFKLLDVLHVTLQQTSVDIFFIDWEREKPIAEGDQMAQKSRTSNHFFALFELTNQRINSSITLLI